MKLRCTLKYKWIKLITMNPEGHDCVIYIDYIINCIADSELLVAFDLSRTTLPDLVFPDTQTCEILGLEIYFHNCYVDDLVIVMCSIAHEWDNISSGMTFNHYLPNV